MGQAHNSNNSSQAEAQPMPGWRRIAGVPEVRGAWLRRCRIACERRRMGREERNLTTSDLLVRARQRGRRGSTYLRTGQGADEAARDLVQTQHNRVHLPVTTDVSKYRKNGLLFISR